MGLAEKLLIVPFVCPLITFFFFFFLRPPDSGLAGMREYHGVYFRQQCCVGVEAVGGG